VAEYDYVIVGAGSAGCVLAGRLSEQADVSVALLEAGGSDRALNVRVPAAFAKMFRTERDWEYYSDPEPGLMGRRLYMPRGKMIGGSSSINAMLYVRGNPEDFDGWAKAGATGWSYDEVLPYFKRSEHFARGADQYHGDSGPLHVGDLRSRTRVTELVVEAAQQAGLPFNPDYNGANQEGVSFLQVTQKQGSRWSAADAWLRPASSRQNLTVHPRTHVLRVEIEKGRATGVWIRGTEGPELIRARREVLLSAGAIGSPQLLMLSGIGPADHLREHGIEVATDSPHVGSHYQDHPFYLVNWETTAKGTLAEAESVRNLADFFLRGRGLLTSTVAEGTAFWRTDESLPAPNMQLHFGAAYFHNHGFDTHSTPAFVIAPTLVAPESRGQIRLRSDDPADKPSIVGNHLTEAADVDAMLAGLEMAREIAAQEALRGVRGREIHPGESSTSREDLVKALRRETDLIYHPTSTARMGAEADSVVDPELRVHGIAGLRVVDASVFPTVTRGNTNAATYMVAEKAADLITGR
jgi:choline dehydrogenase-like flavoprotein